MTATDARLLSVLAEIQRRGGIGPTSLRDAVDHARRFVAALPPKAGRLADLGSGGGLPGLVVALDVPTLAVVLVERRAKRVDLLRYGARALEVETRVEVVAADVSAVAADVLADRRPAFDVVTARSFAPPAEVLRAAHPLLAPGGRLVVSSPPDDGSAGWAAALPQLGFQAGPARPGLLIAQRLAT